jgi:beta-mannosidase
MRRSFRLDGPDWQIQGYLGLDAALAAARRAPRETERGWLPARVPGSVLDDLLRAGEVPNPYVERNSLACEWVPERAWLYRRTLEVPALRDGERALLRFDGLDHAGTVFLDGEPIARHEGMFVPFEVELAVRGGSHRLDVVVEPAPAGEPQWGRTSRVRTHKSRMTYGWDFCPRIVHQGLWQTVSLEVVDRAVIGDVWARPALTPDLRGASLHVTVACDRATPDARVELALTGPGGVVASAGAASAGTTVECLLHVADPALWWPNGHGEPIVHRLSVRLLDGDRLIDERSVPVGFRRVELAANEGGPPGARPYTFVVNGRRLYAKGWNWTPVDALYGVPRPDRLGRLLGLAARSGTNLLRVWGGGLIETPAFYEACDRLGLMVWQEFSQSSSLFEGTPSDDRAFVDGMRREAEVIVPLRRNHPSLVAWCGGNELEGPDGPLDDRAPVLGALRDVVTRLDPDRAWLPTSPTGPRFHNRLHVIETDPDGLHDVHGPWEHQGLRDQYRLYDRGTSLLNSEFGVEGMANRRQHEALAAPERRWPATRENPVYRHLGGEFWANEPVVQAAFGGRLADLDALRRASQWLQAEGLRYAVEANRRRWPRNSGSIPWQLNESYPNAWCTAVVDHHGDPKPAFWAVARAYAPVAVCASFDGAAWRGRDPFEAALWAWTERDAVPGARMKARLVDVDGGVLAEASDDLDLEPDVAVPAGSLVGPAGALPAVFLLELVLADRGGRVVARNRYPFTGRDDFGSLLDLAPATVRIEALPGCLLVEHTAGPAAMGLVVEEARPIAAPGWLELDDNGFDLLPGERREVGYRWAGAPPDGLALTVSAWNVAPVTLEAPG